MSVSDGNGAGPALDLTGVRAMLAGALVASRTLSGNITLTNQSRNVQCIDPGGAGRDVTLPALEEGLFFLVVNKADAAETITVKDAAAATVVSLAQNTSGLVWCDGAAWYLAVKFTSALS
jgi:hypothetical protein